MAKIILISLLVAIGVIMLLSLFEIVNFNNYFLGAVFLFLAVLMFYLLVMKKK